MYLQVYIYSFKQLEVIMTTAAITVFIPTC